MIYELTRQFKIELCCSVGACIVGDSLLRRVLPYAVLCRPIGACRVWESLYIVILQTVLCKMKIFVGK